MEFLFLRGAAIGFSIAAPIGPVGLLCIRKALADGRMAAMVAGLGAAVADTIFGAVVGLGLTAVSHFLSSHAAWLKLAGGLFMIVLGLRTWAGETKPLDPLPPSGMGLWRDFASTFAITITNPATILGVMGVFAAIGTSTQPAEAGDAWLLVLGVFSGSVLWWLVLSSLASAVRDRLTPAHLRHFNHISGALLVLFGALALGSLLLP